MFAKVVVLTFVTAVLCEEHGYTLRNPHEPPKEYRQHYERIPIRAHEEQEGSHEVQYSAAPGGYGHGGNAYSSQSIIHHAALAGQGESQESQNDHVAPVYQYVQEAEEPARYEAPVQHYQTVHYAPAQAHYEVQSHAPVHANDQPQYAHGHEGLSYYHDANAHDGLSSHQGAQLYTAVHPPALVQHAAPVHHTALVHQPIPAHQETPVHHAVPIHQNAHAHDSHDEPIDYYAYPKYQYEYKVEDPHTGDNKFQHEIRDGDVVKGVYGLQEADGSFRTVEYSSDKHTGFNAVVKHSAPGHHYQSESHHHN